MPQPPPVARNMHMCLGLFRSVTTYNICLCRGRSTYIFKGGQKRLLACPARQKARETFRGVEVGVQQQSVGDCCYNGQRSIDLRGCLQRGASKLSPHRLSTGDKMRHRRNQFPPDFFSVYPHHTRSFRDRLKSSSRIH